MRPRDFGIGIERGAVGGAAGALSSPAALERPPPVDAEPQPAASEPARQEVRRRHVLYIPGYMPQAPAQQRRLAGLELRRFAKLWGMQATAGREVVDDPVGPSASWTLRAQAGEAAVDVVYETLRWDDIVARDFAAPLWLKVPQAGATIWDAATSGLLWRVGRAAPWYAVAWLYPAFAWLLAGAAAALKGGLVLALAFALDVEEIGVFVALGVFALGWVGWMHLMRRAGSFVIHLMDDGRSQSRYARRLDDELHARVDAFAVRIRAVALESDADEVLVVGHSSGAFLAIDAVARAYEAESDMGRRGPPLALLTVGATELLVALHPAAGWFRDRIARLAVERTLFWAEVVGPWDALNFPHRCPVTELRLKVPADRPNPTFRRAYLSKMLTHDTIKEIRSRWRVFRLHYQFIMANEVRGPYDFFSLVCGPWTARSQFERTRDGRLMSPHLGEAPPPLARPDYLPPLAGSLSSSAISASSG